MQRGRRPWRYRGAMSAIWPIAREMAPAAYRRAINAVGERFWQAGTVGAIAGQNQLNPFLSESDMAPTGRRGMATPRRSPRSRGGRVTRPPSRPVQFRNTGQGANSPRTPTRRQTRRNSLTSRRRTYTGPGKSGGFIGKSASYTKKKVKAQTENFSKGVSYCRELGTTVTGEEVVYVGHATMPEQYNAYVIGMMLTKFLFSAMKVKTEGDHTLNLVTSLLFAVGDNFILSIRNNSTTLTSSIIGLTVAAGSTVQSLVNGFASAVNIVYSDPNSVIIGIEFVPGGTSKRIQLGINLSGASFTFHVKSTMKVQNQSVIGTDTTTDAVDSVPLHGRYYETTGTVLEPRKSATLLLAQHANGLYSYGQGRTGGIQDLREPPPPSYWKGIVGSGKEKLDPGELKTSVLTTKVTIKINNLHKLFINQGANPGAWTKGGHFRVFAFERMLDNLATPENIRLGVEIDIKYSCKMENKYKDYWAPYNDSKLIV